MKRSIIGYAVKFAVNFTLFVLGVSVVLALAVVLGTLSVAAKEAVSPIALFQSIGGSSSIAVEGFEILHNLIEELPFGWLFQPLARLIVKIEIDSMPVSLSIEEIMYEVCVFAVASFFYHLFLPLMLPAFRSRKNGIMLNLMDYVIAIYFIVTFGIGGIVTAFLARISPAYATVIYCIAMLVCIVLDICLSNTRGHGVPFSGRSFVYLLKSLLAQFIKEGLFLLFLMTAHICIQLSGDTANIAMQGAMVVAMFIFFGAFALAGRLE